MSRASDLDRFYRLLDELKDVIGGHRYLRDCEGRDGWPAQGVYFFFEDGEMREDGRTPRVVRVGTHAVSAGSHTTLWQRLSQHKGHTRGRYGGGGNHRGSVFRLHVGTALINTRRYPEEAVRTWGRGNAADIGTRDHEHPVECDVSNYIRGMPFVWIAVPGPSGTHSGRGFIESNAIALLSNRGKPVIDPPSPGWLGLRSGRAEIWESGLWNVHYVDQPYTPSFNNFFAQCVARMRPE